MRPYVAGRHQVQVWLRTCISTGYRLATAAGNGHDRQMRVAFIGGTRFVGPAAVTAIMHAGHEVAVCHSGAHEHPACADAEHLHGTRASLLGPDGPVDRWRPDALVDTFPGGASATAARQLAACATRCGVRQIVAVSSMDVYQYCVEAGLGDGTGARPLPGAPLPLTEDAPLRSAPYPGGSDRHDNVAMERELHGCGAVASLRCGAIYGPHPSTREWSLVELIARGERRLPLPDGGGQIWHRVAVDRVAHAVANALTAAPDGFFACNVVDPSDWTYAGLANEIGQMLGWEWEPVHVPFADADHPWQARHPVLCADSRLRTVLGVHDPDPHEALRSTVSWLWEHRAELLNPGARRS